MTSSTRDSRVIHASREILYNAFLDPAALAVGLAPGDMTAGVHDFDGGYRMSKNRSRAAGDHHERV